MIKDAPVFISDDEVKLMPILNHIKKMGKQISKQSLSYFNEEDDVDMFVGIEGDIKNDCTIPLDEIMVNGKHRLTLKIKQPENKNDR